MVLLPKHELFCQEYVKDCNGKRAYEAVYGPVKNASAAAARTHRRPDCMARIAELQYGIAERNKVTVDSLVAELDEMIGLAKQDPKSYSAAVNAINSKAKISGNWVDQVQVTAESMTDAQLAEAIKGEQAGSVIPFDKALRQSKGELT